MGKYSKDSPCGYLAPLQLRMETEHATSYFYLSSHEQILSLSKWFESRSNECSPYCIRSYPVSSVFNPLRSLGLINLSKGINYYDRFIIGDPSMTIMSGDAEFI